MQYYCFKGMRARNYYLSTTESWIQSPLKGWKWENMKKTWIIFPLRYVFINFSIQTAQSTPIPWPLGHSPTLCLSNHGICFQNALSTAIPYIPKKLVVAFYDP